MSIENYVFIGVFTLEDLESENLSKNNVIYEKAIINGKYSDNIYEVYLRKDKFR